MDIHCFAKGEKIMARRFSKDSEEEIVVINETAFFNPCDLVNTKTTIPLRVGEERWIYMIPPLFTSPSGDSSILLIFKGSFKKVNCHLKISKHFTLQTH